MPAIRGERRQEEKFREKVFEEKSLKKIQFQTAVFMTVSSRWWQSLLNSARSRDRRLNWHHNAARFGCVQASEQPRSPLDLLVVEISIVGPVEFVGERYASGGKAVGNAPALSTGLSPRPAGRVPVRRTRPQIHRTGATL